MALLSSTYRLDRLPKDPECCFVWLDTRFRKTEWLFEKYRAGGWDIRRVNCSGLSDDVALHTLVGRIVAVTGNGICSADDIVRELINLSCSVNSGLVIWFEFDEQSAKISVAKLFAACQGALAHVTRLAMQSLGAPVRHPPMAIVWTGPGHIIEAVICAPASVHTGIVLQHLPADVIVEDSAEIAGFIKP